MRLSWLAAAAATLAFSGAAHANQFVVNGDFTQLSSGPPVYFDGNVTGWSGNGGYNYVYHDANDGSAGFPLWTGSNGGASSWNGLTASGNGNFAALDGNFNTAAITQTINGLTPNKQYTLSFNYAFGQQNGFYGDTQQNLTVSFGGSYSHTTPTITLPSTGFSGWQTFTDTVTADSTSDVLSFLANGATVGGGGQVPPFALVSDVSLVGAPGPGPATGPLAVLGLLALGYARLRRARQA